MSLEEKSVLFFAALLYDLVNAGLVWEDSPVVVDGNLISSRTPADLPQFCRAIIAALCR
jgi:protease I